MCGHVEEIIGHQIAVEITQAILIPKLYSYKVSLESNRHFVQLAVTSSSGSRKLHYYSARDICVGAVTVSDSIVGDISLACGFSRAYISRHIEQNITRARGDGNLQQVLRTDAARLISSISTSPSDQCASSEHM
ncbi:hypothetical protein JMJ77_0006537 [Colletotrichum scovillei]|uniref:Uncharacterized protein n=1 Tax=Colletotrichum scovillei TaxID=1209932 RepID=A0A9P7UID0_9PEZI|nr:hypothetical protein JMJ77_0006537 [Colletotrichum scovillei]KAG7077810.1 hypothetical protein JMJ76_0015052 [Colletotrichum scovillei]KAG7084931.1 hypothetical protein JMJ78_0010361 [Colletotrichum scovillei]